MNNLPLRTVQSFGAYSRVTVDEKSDIYERRNEINERKLRETNENE